jgi:hypothetical protein
MKHASQRIAQRVLALGMLLGACSPAATPAPGMAAAAELDAAVNRFLSGMQDYNVLRMDPFVEMLAQDPAPFMLDVRELSELEANGYIPGAVVIPLRELGDHLDMLPAFDQPIVAYCEAAGATASPYRPGHAGLAKPQLQDDNSGYREAELATACRCPGSARCASRSGLGPGGGYHAPGPAQGGGDLVRSWRPIRRRPDWC